MNSIRVSNNCQHAWVSRTQCLFTDWLSEIIKIHLLGWVGGHLRIDLKLKATLSDNLLNNRLSMLPCKMTCHQKNNNTFLFNKTHLTKAIEGNTGTWIFITEKHTQQFYNILIGVVFWYHLREQVSKGNSRTEDKKKWCWLRHTQTLTFWNWKTFLRHGKEMLKSDTEKCLFGWRHKFGNC